MYALPDAMSIVPSVWHWRVLHGHAVWLCLPLQGKLENLNKYFEQPSLAIGKQLTVRYQMDVRCRCGAHGHIDEEFAYFYKCLACNETYAVGAIVRLYRLTPELVAKHEARAKSDESLDTGL